MKTIIRASLVVMLTLTNVGIAQADQAIKQGEQIWFTSSTSGLLNRSSVELATEHYERSIRFANKALEKNLFPADALVANHNLCIAYLASDKAESATPYCAKAIEFAQEPYAIVKVRGAYRLQEESVAIDTTVSPLQIVVSNIQQQYPEIRLALLMK